MHDLDFALEQAARCVHGRVVRLARITLAGGNGTAPKTEDIDDALARLGLAGVETVLEHDDGPMRLVAVELDRQDAVAGALGEAWWRLSQNSAEGDPAPDGHEHLHQRLKAALEPAVTEDPLEMLLGFHQRIRLALNTLDALAALSPDEVEPVQARALVEFFEGPVTWHDTDEELSLMPRLQKTEHPPRLERMLNACTRAHERLEDAVSTATPHLKEIALRTAAPDPRRLLQTAKDLREILEPHLRLEEEEVFPLARLLLSENEMAEMGREMRERDQKRRAP